LYDLAERPKLWESAYSQALNPNRQADGCEGWREGEEDRRELFSV